MHTSQGENSIGKVVVPPWANESLYTVNGVNVQKQRNKEAKEQ